MSTLFQGRPPTQEQANLIRDVAKFWRETGDKAQVAAIGKTEEAAKQLVVLTGTLQGLYFAVITVSNVYARLSPGWTWLLLLPLVLWLATLACSIQVFVPQVRSGADMDDVSENAWIKIRDTYIETGKEKLKWLHRAHKLLVTSFLGILFLLASFSFVPTPPTTATQIIVLTPTPLTP